MDMKVGFQGYFNKWEQNSSNKIGLALKYSFILIET